MVDKSQNRTKYALHSFKLAPLKKFSLLAMTKAKNLDLVRLILTFCVIYNDIKDYIWYYDQLMKGKSSVDMNTINPKRGQLAGMQAHCIRKIIATFHEFLLAVKNNIDTLNSREFKLVLHYLEKKFPGSNRHWQSLVELAKGNEPTDDQFCSTLAAIRNTGTYHYYRTKGLFKGLVNYMQTQNDIGFLSMGNTLEETRFYFADAAIQSYHKKRIKTYDSDFDNKFRKYLEDVQVLLRFMVEIYLTKVLGIRLQNFEATE